MRLTNLRCRSQASRVDCTEPSQADRHAIDFGVEVLEPRIVLDAIPLNPAHTVVDVQTNFGSFYIELYDDTAPNTVENFLGYVGRDDYDGSFFHRLVSGFVLQGGGFKFDEASQNTIPVTQQAPVVNEFGASNVQWTVAMAKLGGDPDSATNQWFINLADNAANLDNQNGGFTVFGNVIEGRDIVTTMANLRIVNLGGSTFSSVPVTDTFDPNRQSGELFNSDLVVINNIDIAYDPAKSLVADSTGTPSGVANGSNLTTLVLPNELGRAIAFQQNGLSGGWTVTDLGLKSSTSGTASAPVTWIDPKDSTTYAAAISSDGLILYKNTSIANHDWEARNLTTEISGAELITSNLTVFVDTHDKVNIAGVTAEGKIELYTQTGSSGTNGFTWSARNLSDTDLATAGQTTPQFTSQIASYVTSWNGLNIVGLDANGDIQALWWAPGQATWQVANLTAITGAPKMVGNVSPYLTTWNAINISGTDANGNVVVTWWVPSFNDKWVTSDLTGLFSGPTLDTGSITTYVTPWGGTNVVGRNASGQVVVYWWDPSLQQTTGSDDWQITVLSEFITGADVPTSAISAFTSPSGTINLFGTNDSGQLIRYWWKPGQDWQWSNVSNASTLV